MEKEKKPWFGERWTKGAINWLDAAIFGAGRDVEQISMASIFCWNFVLGILGGFIHGVLSLFIKGDSLNEIVPPIVFGLSLLLSVYLLWNTLLYFNSIWSKIGRSLYVVILDFIACGAGYFVGVWLALVVLAILVLWLVLKMWLGDDSKDKKKVLSDGTELHQTGRGITGEKYYEDDEGNEYREP